MSPKRGAGGHVALRGALAASLGGLVALACGARSSLDEPRDAQGGGGSTSRSSASLSSASLSTSSASTASVTISSTAMSSSTGPACTSDEDCIDGVECTIDVCGEGGCFHEPDDAYCGDGVFCTEDICTLQGCVNPHTDAICDDGLPCTTDVCDAAEDVCKNDPCDGLCDDQSFCNGVERCDSVLGCVAGPPTCDLDLACSFDSCAEASRTCSHAMGFGCAPNVHLLVTEQSGALVDLRPYTGFWTVLAPSNLSVHLDVAILPGTPKRWFAIDPAAVVELFPNTNTVKKTLLGVPANSLAAGPDGFLYAAGTDVYRINPDSGAFSIVGALPPGESSSGDIAFYQGQMIVSTDGPCGGGLARFDLATGTSELIGGDGLGCVYGLAVANGLLFLINCDGTIGTFDPTSGEARILTTSTVTAYGADAL